MRPPRSFYLCAKFAFYMSEIKQAGIKGYVILLSFIGLLLFVALVIYVYKANNNGVPQDPQLYGYLKDTVTYALRA